LLSSFLSYCLWLATATKRCLKHTVLSMLPRSSLVYQSSRVRTWFILLNSADSISKSTNSISVRQVTQQLPWYRVLEVQSIIPPTIGSESRECRKSWAPLSVPTCAIWNATMPSSAVGHLRTDRESNKRNEQTMSTVFFLHGQNILLEFAILVIGRLYMRKVLVPIPTAAA